MGTEHTFSIQCATLWTKKEWEVTMDFILQPLTPLCASLFITPPPLENFICNRRVSDIPDAEHNLPYIFQNTLPVYHYISEFPPDNF